MRISSLELESPSCGSNGSGDRPTTSVPHICACPSVAASQGLADDPERHRIRVRTQDAESKAVSLVNRGATPHERVCYHSSHLVFTPKTSLQWLRTVEFRKKKAAEHSTGTAGEPLMYADDGAIVLLYLLFSEGEPRRERWLEVLFKARPRLSSRVLSLSRVQVLGRPMKDTAPRDLLCVINSQRLSHCSSVLY